MRCYITPTALLRTYISFISTPREIINIGLHDRGENMLLLTVGGHSLGYVQPITLCDNHERVKVQVM